MASDATMPAAAAVDRAAVEARLAALLDAMASQHAGMREALGYSLLGGGKRLRPLLCLWTHDVAGGSRRDAALDAACALEMVHTYSLIHDDLPCMDDDDLRRGRPSAHRRFDEATAVLAGDALLTLAFEVLAALPGRRGLLPAEALDAVAALARAAGTGGLITGQALDLEPAPGAGIERVERIHAHKTGALIAAAMEIGAIVAGASAASRERARRAGFDAGRAFQIADDLLDNSGSAESLGKTPGKDARRGKPTYPAVAGEDVARVRARELTDAALAAMPEARGTDLERLVRFLVDRRS